MQTLEVCLAAGKSTNMENAQNIKYPLLESILAIQNLPLQAMYANRDVAKIFNVSIRAIQNWIAAGRLPQRDLPGRWKHFPQDLEDFLRNSQKERN